MKVDDFVSKVTKLYNSHSCSIRELASVIGLIISVFPAIRPAKLHFRELERAKVDALRDNQGNYDAIVTLPELAKHELSWFMRHSHTYNGTKLVKPSTVITLTTDASLSGWGVVSERGHTKGTWSHDEKFQHINWLELSAIWLGSKCFVRSHHAYVKVLCDNAAAVAYLNNLGGPSRSLHTVACKIWEWCITHECVIEAFHIPGKLNTLADSLSWDHQRILEWKLHLEVLWWICQSLFTPSIDLFASRLNYQVPTYVSWQPDPGEKAIDAFSLHWKDTSPYMFPPFSLIGRVLKKLTRDAVATAIILTPWWPTAHWYPVLLHLACSGHFYYLNGTSYCLIHSTEQCFIRSDIQYA